MAWPFRRISPDVGRDSPAMSFISVVLPLPFGPSSSAVLPGRRSKDTSSSAARRRYFLVTFLISSMVCSSSNKGYDNHYIRLC